MLLTTFLLFLKTETYSVVVCEMIEIIEHAVIDITMSEDDETKSNTTYDNFVMQFDMMNDNLHAKPMLK